MGWLEDQLGDYQQRQNALLAASTGGALAPDEGAPAGAAQAPARDPLQVLLQGAVKYQQQHGQDSLAARVGGGMLGAAPGWGQGRVRLLQPGGTGLAAAGQVTQQGPRAGRAHQTYDLGNGFLANVYFDENGKRQVFKFRKP